jgi:hypothetical protein
VDSWNGQFVDGSIELQCADGAVVQTSHDVTLRTSFGPAIYRERGGVATLAPLATIYGAGPWHDPRRTGGSGLGEAITALVGSHYRSAAPDWSGQDIAFDLLVGDDLDDGTRDLFAHRPWVRVGPMLP